MTESLSSADARGQVQAAGVSIKGLRKSYGSNEVLKGISLEVAPGDVVCLIGPSGSGKSTLLRCVNLLEQPNEGTIHVGGFESTDPDVDIDKMRRKVGMVFQQFNLFPHLTVMQNCTIAQTKVLKRSQADAQAAARKNLARVGLEHFADRFPDQLSGGQQQRVAVARAIVGDRQVLLADEPTGALDTVTGESVLRLLRHHCDAGGTGVLVTHDASHASWADRVIFIRDGRVVDQPALAHDRLGLAAQRRVPRNRLAQQVAGGDLRNPVFFNEFLGLCALAPARRTQQCQPHYYPRAGAPA